MFPVHLIGGHYILQEKCLWVWQFMLMKKTVMSMLRLHHHCRYYNVVIVVIYTLFLVVNHSNFYSYLLMCVVIIQVKRKSEYSQENKTYIYEDWTQFFYSRRVTIYKSLKNSYPLKHGLTNKPWTYTGITKHIKMKTAINRSNISWMWTCFNEAFS